MKKIVAEDWKSQLAGSVIGRLEFDESGNIGYKRVL